jgi:hypothetical protein
MLQAIKLVTIKKTIYRVSKRSIDKAIKLGCELSHQQDGNAGLQNGCFWREAEIDPIERRIS